MCFTPKMTQFGKAEQIGRPGISIMNSSFYTAPNIFLHTISTGDHLSSPDHRTSGLADHQQMAVADRPAMLVGCYQAVFTMKVGSTV
jgi:hypothetical protein